MDMAALTICTFGDIASLNEMVFENSMQHIKFSQAIVNQFGAIPKSYPIMDINPDNLDDWIQDHYQLHKSEDTLLGLNTPFNLLDTDWNKESDFYEWVSSHAASHAQRIAILGL